MLVLTSGPIFLSSTDLKKKEQMNLKSKKISFYLYRLPENSLSVKRLRSLPNAID